MYGVVKESLRSELKGKRRKDFLDTLYMLIIYIQFFFILMKMTLGHSALFDKSCRVVIFLNG